MILRPLRPAACGMRRVLPTLRLLVLVVILIVGCANLWLGICHHQIDSTQVVGVDIRRMHDSHGRSEHVAESNHALESYASIPKRDASADAATFPRQAKDFSQIPLVLKHSTSNTGRQNTTLVILMGHLRAGELAWTSLYNNVLDVYQADLAVITQAPNHRYVNASLFARARHLWLVPWYEDWGDAIDLINGSAWKKTILPLHHANNTLLGGVGKFPGSGAIIFMFRFWVSRMLRHLELDRQYTTFIITRNDHYYLCQHQPTDLGQLDLEHHVYVPKGSDWTGICDRHLIVGSRHLHDALDVLPPLLQHGATKYRGRFTRHGTNTTLVNSEKVLRERWTELGWFRRHRQDHTMVVQRIPRTMFTCGQPGDTTRWTGLYWKVQEGVHLKYPGEYRKSLESCGRPTTNWQTPYP